MDEETNTPSGAPSATSSTIPATPAEACRVVKASAETLSMATASCDSAGTPSDPSAFEVLSTRQREIVSLLAEGLSTKEMATRLNLSVKTIESHRAAAMTKLNATGVAELTKYAVREGLAPL